MIWAFPSVGLSVTIFLFVIHKKDFLFNPLRKRSLNMENYQKILRKDFMNFFRDTEKLNELTPDDRVEIFRTILLGSSDLTMDLLNKILGDYSVDNLEVIELNNGEK